ncbi:MAG: HAD-IB family hydrolase [Micrococcales bacterium]|nr:HAD-IB family hydrolase [Micrococcales bacterium]
MSQPRPKAAAFFDLDKTILATASSAALTRPFMRAGLANKRSVARSAYAQAAYQLGNSTADQTDRLRTVLGEMVIGWESQLVVATTTAALDKVIAPQVFTGAAQLISHHRQAGLDIVICTAAAKEVAEPIATMLGAGHVLATEMEADQGRFTGQIAYFNYGPAKAQAMSELALQQGYDLAACYAYSDSITDLPMLRAVGHAVVVNPSKELRHIAEEAGWEVARFSTPRPIQRRRLRLGLVWAASLVATAVAAGAVTWILRRSPESNEVRPGPDLL